MDKKKTPPHYNHMFFAWNDFVYGDVPFIGLFAALAGKGFICMPRYHTWVDKDQPWYKGKVIETDAPMVVLEQVKRALEIRHDFGKAIVIISEDSDNIIEDVISEKFKKEDKNESVRNDKG